MENPNKYPSGWDVERGRRLTQHCRSQTDEEAIAKDEAEFEDLTKTLRDLPTALVPSVSPLLLDQAEMTLA